MGEELERRYHLVVGAFVSEGGVMYLLKGVKDEETASVLCGADGVLVVEACVPKRLDILLLPRFDISREKWVVFVKGVIILVERGRYPWLVLVCRVRKYKAGDFYSF